jgi:hypothetical protein
LDQCVILGTLTLGSCHQAQEKTKQSHVQDHSPAFSRDPSPVWRENCELPQPESVI